MKENYLGLTSFPRNKRLYSATLLSQYMPVCHIALKLMIGGDPSGKLNDHSVSGGKENCIYIYHTSAFTVCSHN